MSLWWENNPNLWLSRTVNIPTWVSIVWHAACAPSDAKLLEGGVFQIKFHWNLFLGVQWHNNGHHSVSNNQQLDGLLNYFLPPTPEKHQSSALLALCEGNSPVVATQNASNTGKVSIWWRHHETKTNQNKTKTERMYHAIYRELFYRYISKWNVSIIMCTEASW